MVKEYSKAHLLISRAGAGTLFEAFQFGLPMILIPYPYAKQHQLENARVVAKAGGAVIFSEGETTSKSIQQYFDKILIDREFLQVMGSKSLQLRKSDGLELAVDLVVNEVSKKRGSQVSAAGAL